MIIRATRFKVELTDDEIYVIRKGLHNLKAVVTANKDAWGEGYLDKVNDLLKDTEIVNK